MCLSWSCLHLAVIFYLQCYMQCYVRHVSHGVWKDAYVGIYLFTHGVAHQLSTVDCQEAVFDFHSRSVLTFHKDALHM
jgi:hypothetical protein